MAEFTVEHLESNTVRFVSTQGWVDLQLHGDGRASLWTGTYNDTSPEVFGARLWHLLHETMPELGLEVVAAEIAPNQHLDSILIGAGFSKEGVRRSWQPSEAGLSDLALYSILAMEVQFEAVEPPQPQIEPPMEATDG